MPAALAIGEKNRIDGTRFIRAVALGYDVGMRAFKLVAKGGVLSETHNIVGTFGASAACACAVALDTPQMRTLIDYASQQAGAGIGAWRQDTEHVEKSFIDDSVMANLSMQYLIAVLLIDKALSFEAAHDEPRMQDPAILRQKAKINVIADESLERLLPKRMAVVEITFRDGTTMTERNDTVRGSPENPMSSEEVTAKARDLIVPVLGNEKCAKLIDRLIALEEVGDIRELRPLLQR